MAKKTTLFVCQNCGNEFSRWMGRCTGCGEWNTLVEEVSVKGTKGTKNSWVSFFGTNKPQPITAVSSSQIERYHTGLKDLDRVLGGGIVPGSLGLIGGDPGVGKSTLLMQVSNYVASTYGKVLYVSGEESVGQLKERAIRLKALNDDLVVVTEADVERISIHIENEKPSLVLIDSIQAVYLPELTSTPGSVGQVRECTTRFLQIAKGTGIPIMLVGHVTKGGALAGPKVLEHAVDYVLYFEGENHTTFRILRGVKNRFGSTNEIGVFEMTKEGLVVIDNPSSLFLSQRPQDGPGSVVMPSMEGSRPLLVELQALVGNTIFGGVPRRQTTGVDHKRFSMVLAVLEKRNHYPLQNKDVFVNVVGGLKLEEPAADLAIAIAVASSINSISSLNLGQYLVKWD